MKRLALLALVVLAGCGGSAAPSKPAAAPTASPPSRGLTFGLRMP